jgi:DNA-binding transcriptional LysR family regulator
MARIYLPLNALRAFESAGRHLSFTKAAAELNVTPAAISHQVKALEALLEVPLFRRLTPGRCA